MRHLAPALMLSFLATALFVAPARSDTLPVTSVADDGSPGTLRSQIEAASPGDTINFAVTGTIILSQGQILLDKDLTIAGPGVDLLSISGGPSIQERIFEVAAGTSVEIRDLTLKDAGTDGSFSVNEGGGILNRGETTLGRVTMQNNFASLGGAVFNHSTASLSVIDSAFIDNGHSAGCAIYNDGGRIRLVGASLIVSLGPDGPCETGGSLLNNSSGDAVLIGITATGTFSEGTTALINSGTLSVAQSTIDGACLSMTNSGAADISSSSLIGGKDDGDCGVLNSGQLTISDSTLREYESTGGVGLDNSGTAELVGVTIEDLNGGHEDSWAGIRNSHDLYVVNSTLSIGDSSSSEDVAGILAMPGSSATITSSTFLNNDPDPAGFRQVLLLHEGSETTLRNSIIDEGVGQNACFSLGPSTLRSIGGNISSDSSCDTLASEGNFLVQDPLLGPLQDNGGPTLTHALLPGSPAIDFAIDCTYDDDLDPLTPEVPLPSDQRNWLRPAGLACDSGAYESDSVPLPRVTGHRVLDCTAQKEIATLVNGENFTVDLADVATPACLGVGVLMEANAPSGDGSVGHDYIPAVGEVVTSPYEGENNAPFAMMGDSGWAVPGEIAACHCDSPDRGDLTHPGVHVITSTPCSADTVSWTAGDRAAQCEASGGLAGLAFTTSLEVVPEPSFGLLTAFGAMGLAGLASRRR